MQKLILITCFFSVSCFSNRLKINKISESNVHATKDIILDSLLNKSKAFIYLNFNHSRGYGNKNYLILSQQKNKWFKISYINQFGGLNTENKITTNRIATEIADSVNNVFRVNRFTQINTDSMNLCVTKNIYQCYRSDVNTYELVMMQNGKIFSKKGYDIFFVNECCPGELNRQRFIACYEALKKTN